MYRAVLASVALVALAACDPLPGVEDTPKINLPEAVIAVADPRQDLASARVLEEDGCYWYDHVGVVETTPLPLRTVNGNPICTRPQR